MTLWDLKENQSGTILSYSVVLGLKEKTRLGDLGFGVGETIACLKIIPFNGPRLYQTGDSIFSLASEVAREIIVR